MITGVPVALYTRQPHKAHLYLPPPNRFNEDSVFLSALSGSHGGSFFNFKRVMPRIEGSPCEPRAVRSLGKLLSANRMAYQAA
ncbi:hypothetical protein VNO77_17884 [Canavalia gladiata]|uniref:Uncharacterized protein n=1 Tax=Canavalia gladiata TaxID=3824 RepID=A0AAN9LNE5_CANGL